MEEVTNIEVKADNVEKIYAFLSYILFFGVLIYKTQKEQEYVQFHAKQGMMLFAINLVGNLFLLVIPILGWALMFFFNIALVIFFIIGAMNALSGEKKEMPIIGKLANIIK